MYDTLKRTVLISLAALLLLPVFVAAFPTTVQAAPYSDDTVQEKAEAWLFARALSKCFRESELKNGFNTDLIDEGNAKEGKWFYNDPVNTESHDLGIIVASIVEGSDADDGSLECSWGDDNVVDETLSRLGLDPIDALCGMGNVWKRENPGSTPGEACQSGTGHFDTDSERSDRIQEAWNSMVRSTYLEGKGLQESLTDAMRYWISLETFRIGCKADFKAIYTDQSTAGDKKYKTPLYNQETGEIEQWYVETQRGNDTIVVGGNGLFDSDSKQKCQTLEENLDKYIDSYVAAVKSEKETNPDGSQTGSAPSPVCEADGFGWVICPLINMMAQITETVAEFLDDYLRINPLTTDTDSVLYKGWSNIVGIANILLIIAFIFIVFSQVTSIGIGNYGIKKLLPRIIAAAILINISYFICAILVDLSNITGSAISNLIYSNLGGISGDAQDESGFVGGVKNVAGNVAAGLIGVSGLVIVAFFFLIPAVIAILSIFIVLAARTAIITLLIIIAPLAFAAWILPNTDKWFRKWWDLFLQMLVIYPAIMAIFAASTAAATIVVDSTGVSAGETPGPGNLFPLLIGLLIQALPLFALPALIKLSSGLLGRLDNLTSVGIRRGSSGKMGQAVRDKAKSYGKFGAFAAGSKSATFLNNKTGGRVFNPDKPGRMTRAYRGTRAYDKAMETSLEARRQMVATDTQQRAAQLGRAEGTALRTVGGSRYQEITSSQIEEAFAKRKAAIRTGFDLNDFDKGPSHFQAQFAKAIEDGDAAKAGAIVDYLTSARGASGRQALEQTLVSTAGDIKEGSEVHKAVHTAINRDNYSTLVGKHGAVAKGGYEAAVDAQGRAIVDSQGNKKMVYKLKLGEVGTEQLATQDSSSLIDNFDQIKQEEAKLVLANEELRSKISDATALHALKLRAGGATTYTPPTPPTPPPAPAGGGGTP